MKGRTCLAIWAFFFPLPVYRLTAFPQRLNFSVTLFLCCCWHWVRINKLPLSKYLYLNKLLPCQQPAGEWHFAAGRMWAELPSSTSNDPRCSQHCNRSTCAEGVFAGLLSFFFLLSIEGGWTWLRIWLQSLVLHSWPQAWWILPKTRPALPPSPSLPTVVSSGARRWQLCFWLFLHWIILQWSPNKTFLNQTWNVCFPVQKINLLPVVCMASCIFLSLLTVKWLDNSNRNCHKSWKSDGLQLN